MKKVGRLYRESIADHIKDNVENRANTFLLSYTGVSSSQMSTLRKDLKRAGAQLCASKNSMAKLALKNLKFDQLSELVNQQTAFVFADEDSVDISKILVKFAKGFEGVFVRGGLLEGKILEQADVQRLSDLPSRDVLLRMLLGTIQSPLTRLAAALNAKTQDLMSILKQLSEKRGGK